VITSTVRPALAESSSTQALVGGGILVRNRRLGTQLALAQPERAAVEAMTGDHDLEEVESRSGGLSYQVIALLLFRLWDKGLLRDDEAIRLALFPHHDPADREFVRNRRWRTVRRMVSGSVPLEPLNTPLGGLSGVGRGLTHPTVLAAMGLVMAVGLAAFASGQVVWPRDLFGVGQGGVRGIVLAWLAAAGFLSLRGVARAAVLAGVGSGVRGASLRFTAGLVYLDVDCAEAEHFGPARRARFRVLGLLGPGSVAGAFALGALLGGPESLATLAAVGFLIVFVNLCPFFNTDGAGLVELMADLPGQRARVRQYITRNLVGGILRGRSRDGDAAFSAVASLWFAWFIAAFKIFAAVVVPHLIGLQILVLQTDSVLVRGIGVVFLLCAVAWMVLMGIALVVVTFGVARQLLRRPKPAPAFESMGEGLTIRDRIRLMDAVGRLLPDATADSTISELTDGATQERYPRGAWLYHAGEDDRRFYWVLEGEIELLSPRPEGGHQRVTAVRSGKNLGEEALRGGPHLHSARASRDSVVLALPADAFEQALAMDPKGAKAVRQQLAHAAAIGRTPALAALDPGARLELASQLTERSFGSGAEVLRQGDDADCMYLVKSGRVKVVRAGADGVTEQVADLGPGETVGEAGLLFGRPRNATVYATEDSQLIEVPGSALRDALARSFHIGLALETVAARRSGS
jgi:CRP-like cAMP-binding protein